MPEGRAKLGEQQAALVRAVAGGGASPAGFSASGVEMTARSLRNKRLRTVARAWPALEQALGEAEFRRLFLDYARQQLLPPSAMPSDDAKQFVRWLEQTGEYTGVLQRLQPRRFGVRRFIAALYDRAKR